ncbi:MAG: response regulator [Bacteroidetes bacterium]|nr:MAG: response regulator [Bacteroidota bacterium]
MKTNESAPLKVLILEDNPGDARLLVCYLEQAGMTIDAQVANSKNTFLSALLRFRPDMILADYRLPEFNGVDALRVARSLRPNIPFIFITGSVDESVADQSVLAEANAYLLKSKLKDIPKVVKKVMEQHTWSAFNPQFSYNYTKNLIKKETEIFKRTLNEIQNSLSDPKFFESSYSSFLTSQLNRSMEAIKRLQKLTE